MNLMSKNPCAVGALPEETVDALESFGEAAGKYGSYVEEICQSIATAIREIDPEFFYLMYLIQNDSDPHLLSYDEWKLKHNWKDKDNDGQG